MAQGWEGVRAVSRVQVRASSYAVLPRVRRSAVAGSKTVLLEVIVSGGKTNPQMALVGPLQINRDSLHQLNEGRDVGDLAVVSGKYFCPGGTVPREPVPVLLGQRSCATQIKDLRIVPGGRAVENIACI